MGIEAQDHDLARLAARPTTGPSRDGHVVHFYEDAELFLPTVGEFIGQGIEAGQAGLLIATAPHRATVERLLALRGVDVGVERERGTYVPHDAGELLSRFLVDDWPDAKLFREVVGDTVRRTALAGAGLIPVRAFGEMVSLLAERGHEEAAVRLEELWNDLARRFSFSLLCGYPIQHFGDARMHASFEAIGDAHTRVVPGESYTAIVESDARLRAVAALQQKAAALEGEVAARRRLEAELKAKLDELAEVDRRKDEFLAMLGHELRNPLAPVTTALHLMRLHQDDPARVTRARDTIERQVQHLSRLVNDLLDVSRITRGRIELHDETIVLVDVVDRAVEIARPLIDERGHRFTLELPQQPVVFRGDRARLEQVLANLLNNAAKYTDVGGRIWLRARADEAELVIAVTDDGPGLSPELCATAFDLFVQGPETRVRARGGLGIGLTLVRRLVELHGGTVVAESDGPGKGATFTVRLPLRAARRSADGHVTSLEAPAVSRRRILVVDDNVDAADALAELLRDYGHNVWAAHDGTTALGLASSTHPDVVLLDIGMPDLDGYAVARRLRADPATATTLLVALTGYGEERHRQRARDAGFDHHVTKPIDVDQLESFLRTSTAQRS